MKAEVKKLPSGLYLCESPEPATPEPVVEPEPACRCAVCGKGCPVPVLPLGGVGDKNFRDHHPACKHGRFVTCVPPCGPYPGCPVCGTREEYT